MKKWLLNVIAQGPLSLDSPSFEKMMPTTLKVQDEDGEIQTIRQIEVLF